MPPPLLAQSRRKFLGSLGTLMAGTAASAWSAVPGENIVAQPPGTLVHPFGTPFGDPMRKRQQEAYRLRALGAEKVRKLEMALPPVNVDEKLYPNRMGSYSKGLPHNDLGEVDQTAYTALKKAVRSGRPEDFAVVPKGGSMPLGNPQSGFAFAMQSTDTWGFTMRPAPPVGSAETAGEMVELYWHALTRDVPFAEFDTNPLIARAAADLTALSDFRGPKVNGIVTPGTIFRGGLPGDTVGPLISQFLFKNIPHGIATLAQSYYCPAAGSDFVTNFADYLALQRGTVPPGTLTRDPIPRYLRCQRDLTEWVHQDWPAQAYVSAAQILFSFGPSFRNPALPYGPGGNQNGFVTFGIVDLMALLNEVTAHAMRACWYFKWCVHRRVRPEAVAGHLHVRLSGGDGKPFHHDLLQSEALTEIFARNGNYLLPQCYPEGAPPFPAYPSGHSTIAGACATLLKAFFREDASIPSPVVPSAGGSTLEPYTGPTLTVGGEINKLCSNVGIGRNMAGVHYRSDAIDGFLLGEAVAMAYLREHRGCYHEPFDGFRLTRFDGTQVTL